MFQLAPGALDWTGLDPKLPVNVVAGDLLKRGTRFLEVAGFVQLLRRVNAELVAQRFAVKFVLRDAVADVIKPVFAVLFLADCAPGFIDERPIDRLLSR